MNPHSATSPRAIPRAKRGPGAFTLIELLVCIAIIGVLAGLAVSVVGQARQAARGAHCVSNLRQCGVGLQLYANENRGYLPRITWTLEIRPYVSGTFKSTKSAFPVSCPSLPYDDSEYGRSTYSLNSWLDTDHTNNQGGGKFAWDMNLRRVESPSRKIMLFDGILASSDGSGNTASVWAYNAVKGVHYIDFRHRSDTANILFVDGHVTPLKKSGIDEGMWDWSDGGAAPGS